MLQYLKETLGMTAEEAAWSEAEHLPLYLRNGRKYSVLSVEGAELLLIYMEAASFNLATFQKQWKKLSEYWIGELVLCFEKLTTYQLGRRRSRREVRDLRGQRRPCLRLPARRKGRAPSGAYLPLRLPGPPSYLLLLPGRGPHAG